MSSPYQPAAHQTGQNPQYTTGAHAPLQSTAPQYPCPRCRGELAYIVEQPSHSTGIIVLLVGLLLAPVLIGIPIILYSFHLMNFRVAHWHCRGCGTVFPG